MWTPIEKLAEFKQYCRLVWQETRKHKKQLFQNWNGFDYYRPIKCITNKEFCIKFPGISNSKNLFKPIIEHKLSLFYGFKNNIDPKIIGGINNLCISCAVTNSMKNQKIEADFNIYLMNKILEV